MLNWVKISYLALLPMIFFGLELEAMTPLELPEILFTESSTVGHSQAFLDESMKLNAEDVYRQHWNAFTDVDSSKKVVESGALWLKIAIDNTSQHEIVVYLRYLKALSGSLDLYQIQDSGPKFIDKTGFLYPWNERTVKDRRPTFRLVLNPGAHLFLVRAYHPNGGGVPAPRSLLLINQVEFIESVRNDAILGSFIQGIVAFALIYNFFIFMTLRNKHYVFYICSMLFLYLAASLGNSGDVNSYFFRDRPTFSMYISLSMVCGILGTYFFSTYTVEFLKTIIYAPIVHRVLKAFQYFLLFLLVTVSIEIYFFNSILWSMIGLVAASMPLSIVFSLAGIQGVRRNYRPAWYYLVAYASLTISSTVNVIQQSGSWEYNSNFEWVVSIGMCVQTCLLSLGLGDRVKFEAEEASKRIQGLNDELKVHIEHLDDLVAEKTNKIRYIMDHINIGIFKINKNNMIDTDYSKACEKIFAKQDLAKLSVRDLIWDERAIHSEKAQLLDTAIAGCLGEVEINFDVNLQCYPLEMDYQGKQLELEWAAIIENGIVNGYLVSIKDVSYIKKLEKESQENLQEAKSLINITRFKRERVSEYISSELEMIEASRRLSLELKQLDEKTKSSNLAIILRNLHTMKGNARTYGMDEGSALIHTSESEIAGLHSYEEKMEQALVGIQGIEDILRRHLSVIDKYFPSTKKDEQDVEDKVVRYIDVVEKIGSLYPAKEVASYLPTLPDIAAFLRQNNAATFQEILEPIHDDLPRLCEKLHKSEPEILVNSRGLFVRKAYVSKLRSIFNHLVRNSLDHGFESAQERAQRGKTLPGSIVIDLHLGGQYHMLSYHDDGRGLDLSVIIDKSREMGFNDKHTVIEAARNVFEPRFSTKDEVSEISGRGIGLDAVKDTINALNGRIDIHLLDAMVKEDAPMNVAMGKSLDFEFTIYLPRELFL